MMREGMEDTLLIACGGCRRQYDVGGMRAGERIRCRCGEILSVPAARPREARILHCSGCGGKLRDASRKCEYCGGEITTAERNLGPACPLCFARLGRGARFCCECGTAIRPESMRAVRASARCPRCAGELVLREIAEGHYTECTSCAGIWLDPTSFDRLVEKKDQSAPGAAFPFPQAKRPAAEAASTVKYIPCPVCGQFMHRKNFGSTSGIIIDWCKGHGIWFDTHELEKVVSFVGGGGLDRARKLELERMKAQAAAAEARTRAANHGAGRVFVDQQKGWIDGMGWVFQVLGDLIT
jgi:Zn-finger nucleic acid-binding protein